MMMSAAIQPLFAEDLLEARIRWRNRAVHTNGVLDFRGSLSDGLKADNRTLLLKQNYTCVYIRDQSCRTHTHFGNPALYDEEHVKQLPRRQDSGRED